MKRASNTVLILFSLGVFSGCPQGEPDGNGNADATYPPTDGITASGLESVVADLAADNMDGRNEGTAGGAAAQDYLVNLMEACGMEPGLNDGYRQTITAGDGTNLIARIPGTDSALSDRFVILSAHYDHLGGCGGQICNGAYDNAAGVAAVMATGCALAQAPRKRSFLIALWDAEEPPTFLTAAMGSQFYANNPPYALEKTDAVVVLDLVGAELWPGYQGTFLMGAEKTPALMDAVDAAKIPDGLVAQRGGIHLPEQTVFGQQPWSDYDAFRDRNVPFVFMTAGQNKRYHEVNDDMTGINAAKLALETQLLLDLAVLIGDSEATFEFNTEGKDDAADVATVMAVLDAALASGGLVDTLGLSSATRNSLQADLNAVQTLQTKIDNDSSLFGADLAVLRSATQRIMCLAGPQYPESTCNQL
jgi:Zn-dependent M28 family amino/carboxypeptidase